MSLRGNLNVIGKVLKNLLCSNSKRSYKIDKDNNESVETIYYKIKFINSTRLMASSLSNLVDNLTEGIYKIKYKGCDCFL